MSNGLSSIEPRLYGGALCFTIHAQFDMVRLRKVGKPWRREEDMEPDEKIRRLCKYIKEDLSALTELKQSAPLTPLGDIQVRGWLLALNVHFEHLEHLLHDVQPTLPM